MDEVTRFGAIVLLVSGAFAVAVFSQKVSERLRVPTAAFFLLGAALAPTDPAVMFSVFGRKEIGGRTGTILEGESGANDPVGIALMLAAVSLAEAHPSSAGEAVGEFLLQLGVGVVGGVAGAYLLMLVMRR